MKTKKSLIKIKKMREVRKINREMETLRFMIIKKSKYDCYMNDDYTSLICEFLLSKLSQLMPCLHLRVLLRYRSLLTKVNFS